MSKIETYHLPAFDATGLVTTFFTAKSVGGCWLSNNPDGWENYRKILARFDLTEKDITATRSAVCTDGKKFVTSDVVDGKVSAAVSTNNPAFVSAVRNTPTSGMPEDMPTDWGTYGTVGAALAALAAFVKWAKAKIVAVIGDDGKPTNTFATDLLGKQVAKAKLQTIEDEPTVTSGAVFADAQGIKREPVWKYNIEHPELLWILPHRFLIRRYLLHQQQLFRRSRQERHEHRLPRVRKREE